MSRLKPASLPVDLRRRISQFVSAASTEITTHDSHLVPALADQLAPGSTVYVAHTPKATLAEVVKVAIEVQSRGLAASPHLVARRLTHEHVLRDALRTLKSAGVNQLLVIAGDLATPAGPFSSSLDVIESGVLDDAQFEHVAFAGHPEGNSAVADEHLWDALRRKQVFATRTGINAHVVTQFGFDAACVTRWERQLTAQGISMPVHVGIAGPTPLHKLLRFAVQCGVGASLQSALRNPTSIGSVLGNSTMHADMIASLVQMGAGSEGSRIIKPHLFTFGGALSSAQWIQQLRDASFDD